MTVKTLRRRKPKPVVIERADADEMAAIYEALVEAIRAARNAARIQTMCQDVYARFTAQLQARYALPENFTVNFGSGEVTVLEVPTDG